MTECKMCKGKQWITLIPMNFVAPCLKCSGGKKLSEIEADAGGTLQKIDGQWEMVVKQ